MDHKGSDETWAQRLETETRPARGVRRQISALEVPGLTILCHPDPQRIGERAVLPAIPSGQGARLSRLEPVFAAPDGASPRPLADAYLSRRPLHLRPTAAGGVRIACEDCRISVCADGEPIDSERQLSADDLKRGIVLLLAERVALLLHTLPPSPPQGVPRFGMAGESAAFVAMCREIERAAELSVPVLLLGETGSGKELVAAAIHQAGPRRSRPYCTVNMAAIPTTLAAAELFGAARGAFTGAERQRRGYFHRADGGTLLLDEIGETPPEVQVLLLRTLESGEIQPVGAAEPQRVDVRVIAATDADLQAKIAAGTFRAPLLHRLGGYEIHLPPLAERRDDIGRLLLHFLRQELDAVGQGERLTRGKPDSDPWLPAPLVARLAAYAWPGNVRQLQNVARQLVIANHQADEARITPRIERLLVEETPPSPRPQPRRRLRPAREVGEEELLRTLRAHRWRLQPAAAALGISRTALYGLIEESDKVCKPRDLSRQEIARAHEDCGGKIEAMVDALQVSRKGLKRRMTELKFP